MNTTETEIVGQGDEVMKAVGELKQLTHVLNETTEESESDAEEIGNWITVIGKAILAVFK